MVRGFMLDSEGGANYSHRVRVESQFCHYYEVFMTLSLLYASACSSAQ